MLARKLISRILIPTYLTPRVLRKYIRKAIQNKSWYRLSQLQRALLYAASKTVNKVRSPTLHRLLEEILLEIELAGTKGQAIYYGVILLLTLNPNILPEAEKQLGKSFDIMGDLIPWMIDNEYNVKAYVYKGPWYDIGSLERYKKLNHQDIKEFLRNIDEQLI